MGKYYVITEQQKQKLKNDPAAQKYLEWRRYVDSGEYQRDQDSTKNYIENQKKELELQRIENEKKTLRAESKKNADYWKDRLNDAKSRGASIVEIKRIELKMIGYLRNSFDPSSEDWQIWNTKFDEVQDEYRKEVEIEKQKEEEEEKNRLEREREEEKNRLERERLEKERIEKLNLPLKKFVGKTVNVYNDRSQQKLYGTETIKQMSYYDGSNVGDRSGIYIYTQDGLEYELLCLANPNRFADYLVLHKKYTSDYKYNSSFVNAVASVSPNFCKKPKADFSSIQKPKSNNIS